MKKSTMSIIFGVFFVGAIFVEAYCLLEFRSNLFAVTAPGVLALVSGFFFMDGLVSVFESKQEDRQRLLKRHFDEMGELHRAMLEQMGENHHKLENLLLEVQTSQEDYMDGWLDDLLDEIADIEGETAKLIIRHNKEDLKKVGAVLRAGTDQMISSQGQGDNSEILEDGLNQLNAILTSLNSLSQSVDKGMTELRDSIAKMENAIKNISALPVQSVSAAVPAAGSAEKPAESSQPDKAETLDVSLDANFSEEAVSLDEDLAAELETGKADEILDFEPEAETGKADEILDFDIEETAEEPLPEIEAEPIVEEEAVPEPELIVEEELIPEPEPEPIPEPEPEPEPAPAPAVSSDPNHVMTPEEIAALIAGNSAPAPEPEPEPEPAPAPAPSADPNHVMTPEEIAALLNNMGS